MVNCQPLTPLSTCTRVLNGRRDLSFINKEHIEGDIAYRRYQARDEPKAKQATRDDRATLLKKEEL